MPITDYKVTDIERDAVRMEGKADPLTGTLAQNQAEFDEYPELIRDNLDGLCDFIATMPISYTSSAAASTANKGAITGFVPLGAIVEISMTNGNTAVSPTISIDGVTHTITGMPTVAQVQANSTQTYRFVKTGASALTFTKNPDYICEYGTHTDGWVYERKASGKVNCKVRKNIGTVAVDYGEFVTSTSQPSVLYIKAASIGVNYPFTFSAVTTAITSFESCSSHKLFAIGGTAGTTTVPPTIVLARLGASATNSSLNVILNNDTYGTWY